MLISQHLLLAVFSWELTDWLLRRLKSAPLNAFPLRSPRGAFKPQPQEVAIATNSFYLSLCLQVNLRQGIKKRRYHL